VSEPEIAVSDEIHAPALPRRVFGSFLWLGSASVVGQIVSWLSAILVIRLLSPSDYGIMAMASLPVGLLMLIGDLGVGSIVVQAPTLDRPRLKALFGACLLAHLLGAAILFVGAPLVAGFFAEPRVVLILRALSFSFVCLGFSALPRALMARDLQFDRRAKIDVVTALVSSFVALALAMRGWEVWSLVGATLVMYAFRAVACQLVYPCLFLPFPALRELRGSVRFGSWVTLDRIIWFGYTNVDVAIAGRALGDTLVGVYTVALSLASMPIDKVMSIVNEISFSAFSRMQGDRERIRSGMLRSLESVSLLAFPTFFGMAMVAPELIEAVLGPKWTGAILPLQILCIAFPFRALGVFFAPALLGTGQARLVVENNLITLVAVAVAMGVGVHWGVIGLCVAWVVGYVPTFVVNARRTLTALQTPGRQVAGTIGFSMAAALAMAVAVAGARTVTGEALPVPVELAILILFGAGMYGAVVVAFRPRTLRTLWILGTGK
jgi:O-antigen/teichoic acid export membrane protein